MITNADRDDALEGVEEGKTVSSRELHLDQCADAQKRSPLAAIWEKRLELSRLTDRAAILRGEIRRAEQERERANLKRLAPHQRRIVQELVSDEWGEETWCHPFRSIAAMTGLTRQQVSRACKALKRLGFVELHRGLFTDDGEVAGSGYRLSKVGHEWWWARENPPSSAEQVSGQVPGTNTETQLSTGEQP